MRAEPFPRKLSGNQETQQTGRSNVAEGQFKGGIGGKVERIVRRVRHPAGRQQGKDDLSSNREEVVNRIYVNPVASPVRSAGVASSIRLYSAVAVTA